VGLQRGTTPQPDPKDEEEKVEHDEVLLSVGTATIPDEEIGEDL